MYGLIVSEIGRGAGAYPFVARLTGFDPKYVFKRVFVRGVHDYSYVSRSNRRRGRALKAGAHLVTSTELVTRSIRVKKGS